MKLCGDLVVFAYDHILNDILIVYSAVVHNYAPLKVEAEIYTASATIITVSLHRSATAAASHLFSCCASYGSSLDIMRTAFSSVWSTAHIARKECWCVSVASTSTTTATTCESKRCIIKNIFISIRSGHSGVAIIRSAA